jgi:hypothetical protein
VPWGTMVSEHRKLTTPKDQAAEMVIAMVFLDGLDTRVAPWPDSPHKPWDVPRCMVQNLKARNVGAMGQSD